MIALATVALGLALLIGGGTAMVQGASLAAVRLGWSPMVVGLTIVGFGTSAPELVVSVIAAVDGVSELVFGNVIGSNIANIGLILGLAALISPLEIHGQLVRREVPLLVLGTVAIFVMSLYELLFAPPPVIDLTDSIILFLLFAVFLYMIVIGIRNTEQTEKGLRSDIEHSGLTAEKKSIVPWWLLLVGGLALLILGGKVTVDGSVALAGQFGIPNEIIGLFVVAIGTSLPELSTSVIAAIRGESDLAVGNVVGSNIFNGLFVLPVSGFIANVAVPVGGILDVAVSLAFALMLVSVFYLCRARISRTVGAVFLSSYVLYTVLRLTL